jgi:DNA-binding response OmpR family regulator
MPMMNGYTWLQSDTEIRIRKNVPIIAITAGQKKKRRISASK